jgi:hypothetical protein
MPPVWSEPTTSTSKRAKTVRALDQSATVTGGVQNTNAKYRQIKDALIRQYMTRAIFFIIIPTAQLTESGLSYNNADTHS